MTDSQQNSSETRSFTDANASLRTGVEATLGTGTTVKADRLEVQEFTGNQVEVLVYQLDGKRRIERIRLGMHLQSSSPVFPVTPTGYQFLEALEPDEEKRLLDIYDKFEKRSFR
jgi:hypothetical protein